MRNLCILLSCKEGEAQCHISEYEEIVNEETQEKEKSNMLEKMIKDAIIEVSSGSVGSMYSSSYTLIGRRIISESDPVQLTEKRIRCAVSQDIRWTHARLSSRR